MGARRFVTPTPDETFDAIAARVVSATDAAAGDSATDQLLSWNLHLAARRGADGAIGLLPSDIVFTEPPPRAP